MKRFYPILALLIFAGVSFAGSYPRAGTIPAKIFHGEIDWSVLDNVPHEELAMTAQSLEDNCLEVRAIAPDLEGPHRSGYYVLLSRHIDGCVIAP